MYITKSKVPLKRTYNNKLVISTNKSIDRKK